MVLNLGHTSPRNADLLRLIFQGRWRLKVLKELSRAHARLSELRRRVPDCTKKVLIDTLHGLEKLSFIEWREFETKARSLVVGSG